MQISSLSLPYVSEMREPPYYINYSKPRLLTHNIITSKYFDLAIAAVIGLNVVTMATEFYMMPMVSAETNFLEHCLNKEIEVVRN